MNGDGAFFSYLVAAIVAIVLAFVFGVFKALLEHPGLWLAVIVAVVCVAMLKSDKRTYRSRSEANFRHQKRLHEEHDNRRR